MTAPTPGPDQPDDSMRGSVHICVTAIVAGVLIGFVGGAFRWCLQTADDLRIDFVDWAHRLPGPGWLVPMAAVAACATLAALIVRWEPLAAGSGIQHVEAVFRGEAQLPLIRLLPAKFIGGVLSIGSGLVLGREGPTVHMGAAIGAEAGRRARLPDPEVRMMQTALGGAGLAVAFNAPIGGTLFTLEEVTKSFRVKTVLATLFSAVAAVSCSRLILGNHADFHVETFGAPALAWCFSSSSDSDGGLGAVYNRLLLWFLDHVAAIREPDLAKRPSSVPSRGSRCSRTRSRSRQRPPDTRNPRRTPVRSFRRHRLPCGAVHRGPIVVLGCCARRNIRAAARRGCAVGSAVRRRLRRRMARRRNAVDGSDGDCRNGGVLRGYRARARDGDGARDRDDGDDRVARADDGRDRSGGVRRVRRGIPADL